MRNCDVCGGSIIFINGSIAKCEYCGRLFQVNGDNLSEVNMESLYKEALELFNRDSEDNLLNAVEIFEALGSYKDSSNKVYEGKNKISKAKADEADRKLEEQRQNELAEIARKKREYAEKQRKKIIAITSTVAVAVVAIIIVAVSVTYSKKNDNYQKAVSYFNNGEYENAIEIFEKLGGYKDSVDYLSSAHESITTREDAYNKGVAYFNEGLYLETIDVLAGMSGYLDSNEYIENACGKLYEQGEQFFSMEEYEKARDILGNIPETSGSYTKTVALLKKVDEKLVEIQNMQEYENAVNAYESGEYEKAQRLFIEIRDYLDSMDYLNKIGDSFYATATDLFNTGDYSSCGDYLLLIDTADEWGRYSEAADLFNQAKEIYYNQIAEEAKNICRSQGETEMRSFVNGKKCALISDDSISSLLKEGRVEIVSLEKLEPYYKPQVHTYEARGVEDILGNIYDYVLESNHYSDGDPYDWCWKYAIDGKYRYFRFVVAVEKDYVSNGSYGEIRIFGDGRQLYALEKIGSDTKSFPVEINVEGITDLGVMVGGDSHTVFCIANPVLSE
ncbi:Tetratricopeptide repeat-containing protein [Butyrivibrio sp. ob235]|uniref:NPCBM/NEW2 domain-containing protein n=1 Tax=Butyrivibrio sp. ob235 TaxID=1761780 RepID=UPI0008C6006A|nr:NPCBM/NEW2 domain-containing protein [Butyrivibrio sp. ob235]SEM23014.1 Tetratricopeptide repeat-containing protein [Butyrivibrio sp. ob235]